MSNIQQHKINSVLSKKYNYRHFGIMTRKEFILHVKNNGGTCEQNTFRDYEKEEIEREWLKRNAFNHPFGNENHPETKAYNERKRALQEDGIFKTTYTAIIPMPGLGSPYMSSITKTEYDFFKSLTTH